MNSIKNKLRSSKASNRISNKIVPKKKKIHDVKSRTTHSTSTLSRKTLVAALAEMGIVTPSSMKTDVLRSLYEANIQVSRRDAASFGTIDQVTLTDSDDEDADAIGGGKMRGRTITLHPDRHDQKENQSLVNERGDAGKSFSLFSHPVAEEVASFGDGGYAHRGENDLESVPKGLSVVTHVVGMNKHAPFATEVDYFH